MQAVIWSAMSTSSRTSRAVPASKRVTSIRFSTRSFSRRVSLTTSRTAGSIIGSMLPVSASSSSSSTSVTAVMAVSGVRSSWLMSATNRRDASSRAAMSATRFSSASAALLNVRDRSASSSVPGHPEPGVQLALAEPPRGRPEPLHRLQHGRRGGLREERRADQREPRGDPQRPGQQSESNSPPAPATSACNRSDPRRSPASRPRGTACRGRRPAASTGGAGARPPRRPSASCSPPSPPTGASRSEKPLSPPELPLVTVLPSAFFATSSTLNRWLLLAI
ncbi:hypothetical protein SVIOM74S_01149 [Streptomyces violarus]